MFGPLTHWSGGASPRVPPTMPSFRGEATRRWSLRNPQAHREAIDNALAAQQTIREQHPDLVPHVGTPSALASRSERLAAVKRIAGATPGASTEARVEAVLSPLAGFGETTKTPAQGPPGASSGLLAVWEWVPTSPPGPGPAPRPSWVPRRAVGAVGYSRTGRTAVLPLRWKAKTVKIEA